MTEKEVLEIIEQAARDGRTKLYLWGNLLTNVPAELGNLTNLSKLDLDSNQLTSVPAELGNLTNPSELYLDNNPLESPPTEVVGQGTKAVLAYLRKCL